MTPLLPLPLDGATALLGLCGAALAFALYRALYRREPLAFLRDALGAALTVLFLWALYHTLP